jgi:hypothetical protein
MQADVLPAPRPDYFLTWVARYAGEFLGVIKNDGDVCDVEELLTREYSN